MKLSNIEILKNLDTQINEIHESIIEYKQNEIMDFLNYKNPLKIICSDNFIKKISNFYSDERNKTNIEKLSFKIGIKPGYSYCLITKSVCHFIYTVTNNQIILFNFLYTGEFLSVHKIQLNATNFLPLLSQVKTETIKKFTLEPEKMMLEILNNAILIFKFLHFIEIKMVTLKPNEKYQAKNDHAIKNSLKTDVIIADINWDIEAYRDLPFGVKGHYRMQPVGPKNDQKIKIIYIEPFVKKGYHRLSGKELNKFMAVDETKTKVEQNEND